METKEKFPDPHKPEELKIPPELEGWEEMYPPYYLFSKEREEWEDRHFWYLDKMHHPEPMYPLDLIHAEAWQQALSQYTTRTFCIPPAQGVAHRIVGCYLYITPVEAPSPEIQKEKTELFKKRVLDFVFKKYGPEMWESWLKKYEAWGREMAALKVPERLPKYEADELVFPEPRGYSTAHEVLEAWNKLMDFIFRGWQYHFQYLNLTYLAYLTFTDTCRKLFPGISDSVIGKMVAGAYVHMFRPEEELCALARLAMTLPGVPEILKKDIPAEKKIEELKKTEAGRRWLEEYNKREDPWWHVSCGSGFYHTDGSWTTMPDVPFGFLKSYIERLERGETIERPLREIDKRREELVAEYRKLIPTDEDRATFDEIYDITRRIYSYAENHLFWHEHWFHTIFYRKVREFGKLLVNHGVLKDVDDIFYLNRFEVAMVLEDLCTAWSLGEGVSPRAKYWQEKVERRKKILEAAKKWVPPPALGTPPKEVAEPFTVMLWGITTEKVREWLRGVTVKPEEVTELIGFPASPGVAEGPARVIKFVEEIDQVQSGEILVCPCTNPSWAPVFTKIRAAVTDIGGITSHAAIVCREYGLPSVTGCGIATTVIKTGDIIRVDGDKGVVTIIRRASQS